MRISDWSSDVCSSDLRGADRPSLAVFRRDSLDRFVRFVEAVDDDRTVLGSCRRGSRDARRHGSQQPDGGDPSGSNERSEEHTSELQSLMRISYAVFCLKKKKKKNTTKKEQRR